MADIRDKIAKLLSLAQSPNENEAKAALLKARQLMAENKLLEADIQAVRNSDKVVRELIGVTCSGQTNTWAVELSAIIASHYCCVAWKQREAGKRHVTLGFCGLQEDFEICKSAFMCAYDYIKYYCENSISRESDGTHGAYRKRCNAYGWGFVIGLTAALKQQSEEHKEWGLVMVVPEQVTDAMSDCKVRSFGNFQNGYDEYKRTGYQHGKQFNLNTKLVTK